MIVFFLSFHNQIKISNQKNNEMDEINREQQNQEKTPGLGRDHMLRDEDESEKRKISDNNYVTAKEKTEKGEWKKIDQQHLNDKNDS
jgi:hypothetical protein